MPFYLEDIVNVGRRFMKGFSTSKYVIAAERRVNKVATVKSQLKTEKETHRLWMGEMALN